MTALFAGGSVLFKRLISKIRGEDYDIDYNSANPFTLRGNGFREGEMQEDSDLAWYVEQTEEEPARKSTRRMVEDEALGLS